MLSVTLDELSRSHFYRCFNHLRIIPQRSHPSAIRLFRHKYEIILLFRRIWTAFVRI